MCVCSDKLSEDTAQEDLAPAPTFKPAWQNDDEDSDESSDKDTNADASGRWRRQ